MQSKVTQQGVPQLEPAIDVGFVCPDETLIHVLCHQIPMFPWSSRIQMHRVLLATC